MSNLISKFYHHLSRRKWTIICFEFQPQKCISLNFNGHHMVPSTVFSMADGKFLGHTIGVSPNIAQKTASANMKQQILQFLQHIDKCSIWSEYKVWILKNFVSSVLHFHFAVERLTVSSISSGQPSILKFGKSWLNLPQNCTPGTVFHPDVLNLPFLPQSAKLSYFLAIEQSVDPLPDNYKLYADLPRYLASICPHIPTNLFSSLSRPDLVLVSNNSICLFKLTIPINTQQHLLAAKTRKEDWYGCSQCDLQLSGLSVNFISIEIGCLGHFMPDTIA